MARAVFDRSGLDPGWDVPEGTRFPAVAPHEESTVHARAVQDYRHSPEARCACGEVNGLVMRDGRFVCSLVACRLLGADA